MLLGSLRVMGYSHLERDAGLEKRSGSPQIFLRSCKIHSLVSRGRTALKRPEITVHVQLSPMRFEVRPKLFFGVARKPFLRSWAKLANVFSFTAFCEFDRKLVERAASQTILCLRKSAFGRPSKR